MRIRRMMPDDAESVAYIEQNTFSQPWSRQGFLDSLKLPDVIFLVAEKEAADKCGNHTSVIVGYIGMYISLEEGEITNVAVREPDRGEGIGKALVGAMLKEADSVGVSRIVLEVRVTNASAIHVYEEMGFRRVGIRKGFYEKPKEDAGIMVWEK